MSKDDDITQTSEYKKLQKLLVPFLGSDERFEAWMLSENPMLGMVAPIDMLFLGRGEKLLKLVKQLIDDNTLWQNRN